MCKLHDLHIGKGHNMLTWTFTFDGIDGFAEAYKGGAFIAWGGMGFHLDAACPELYAAIMDAKPL